MLPCGNIVVLFFTSFSFSESVMKPLLLLCLALLTVPPAQAARRVGEAEVRTGANGVPCFTISQREERRGGAPDFGSITVMPPEDGAPMWRMAMPAARTFPVAFAMCIPYGGRIPALPQTPAAALNEGVPYTVVIDTRPGKDDARPLRYQARFCLVREGGGVVTRQLGAGGRPGRTPPACPLRPGSAPREWQTPP